MTVRKSFKISKWLNYNTCTFQKGKSR